MSLALEDDEFESENNESQEMYEYSGVLGESISPTKANKPNDLTDKIKLVVDEKTQESFEKEALLPIFQPVFNLSTYNGQQKFRHWFARQPYQSQCEWGESFEIYSDKYIHHCLDQIGYPNASISILENERMLDVGRQIIIDNFDYKELLNEDIQLAPEFVSAIEEKPLSKANHIKALEQLHAMGFLKNGSFDYYASERNNYDAVLTGQPLSSSFAGGLSISQRGRLLAALMGRHFFDYQGLRYIDYFVGVDANREPNLKIDLPIYYDLNRTAHIKAKAFPKEYEYFATRNNGIELSVETKNYLTDSFLDKYDVSVGISQSKTFSRNDVFATKTFPARGNLALDLYSSSTLIKRGDLTLSLDLSVDAHSMASSVFQTHLSYDSKKIPVGYRDLDFRIKAGIKSLVGSFESLPQGERLYLGGVDSVRGLSDDYIGSSENIEDSGGDHQAILQLELSRKVNAGNVNLDVGVHMDWGYLGGGPKPLKESHASFGLFTRTQNRDGFNVYGHLSLANSNTGTTLFGIGVETKF